METSLINYYSNEKNYNVSFNQLFHFPTPTILEHVSINNDLKDKIKNDEEFWKQKLSIDFGYSKEDLCNYVDVKNKSYLDLCKLCHTKQLISVICSIDVYRNDKKFYISCYSEIKGFVINRQLNPFYEEAKEILKQEYRSILQKEKIEFVAPYHVNKQSELIGFRKEDAPKFYYDIHIEKEQREFTTLLMMYHEICVKLFEAYDVDCLVIKSHNHYFSFTMQKIKCYIFIRIPYKSETSYTCFPFIYRQKYNNFEMKQTDSIFYHTIDDLNKRYNLSSIVIQNSQYEKDYFCGEDCNKKCHDNLHRSKTVII